MVNKVLGSLITEDGRIAEPKMDEMLGESLQGREDIYVVGGSDLVWIRSMDNEQDDGEEVGCACFGDTAQDTMDC